ncbi:type I-E CRISPR-associated protein Cse1/CasA [Pseudomonas lopnurensis]|uniref:type I-E CRISPR-associated protein Cse1/CasA n=1 Tax=Pseudomonas lopnurensis TaxID=1477517 RepID=UPI00187A6ACE|nr:type I-E CRISPR-associated protein Cse1/CasA [Pseudomonas lopnurensis]MBE7376856.1 type I-E CRISPR-associated protein Cse1/CasA [Pseudomonas lopnurensis]
MDLLQSAWMFVRQGDGGLAWISPFQIGESAWHDLHAPRPDFRGALYQFLIGLLQTAYAPQDNRAWRERWANPPSAAELEAAFAPYRDAFVLEGDGPAFMQDLQLPADANQLPVLNLLIDAGSDSNQFFNKPADHGLCASCFTQALLTLQLNAPPGGRGTRTSLRGGGPLTTLLVPAGERATLWQRLWLNVLPVDALGYPKVKNRGDVLPWLQPTRTSDAAGVGDTTPETVHPLQAYWSMPRRIRLDDSTAGQGDCTLCGAGDVRLVRHYRTRYGGTNYTGAWVHPLTPYSLDAKGEKPPLSIKGQRGGIAYRHWLGLTLGNEDKQPEAARVVRHFTRNIKRPAVRLWCFGYDMDNMKARCWYDSTLPVHALEDDDLQKSFAHSAKQLLDVASDTAKLLHQQVKAAWFKRPGDTGSEPAIAQSFWQRSEAEFYGLLEQLSACDLESPAALASLYRRWLLRTRSLALELFDEWAMAAPIEDLNLERVTKARAGLGKELNNAKAMKALWKTVNSQLKERA